MQLSRRSFIVEAGNRDSIPFRLHRITFPPNARISNPDVRIDPTYLRNASSDVRITHTYLRNASADVRIAYTYLRSAGADVRIAYTYLRNASADVRIAYTYLRNAGADVRITHTYLRTPNVARTLYLFPAAMCSAPSATQRVCISQQPWAAEAKGT